MAGGAQQDWRCMIHQAVIHNKGGRADQLKRHGVSVQRLANNWLDAGRGMPNSVNKVVNVSNDIPAPYVGVSRVHPLDVSLWAKVCSATHISCAPPQV